MTICEMTCTICVTRLVVGRVTKGSSAVVSLMYTTLLSGSLERRRGTTVRVQVCRSVRVIWGGSSQVCSEVSCLSCLLCQSTAIFLYVLVERSLNFFGHHISFSFMIYVGIRTQIRVYVHEREAH